MAEALTLNIGLNKVLELYNNDKARFPLHRFFTKITTPLLKKLLVGYLKTCGLPNITALSKPGKIAVFLKHLHADVEQCGLKRFVTKAELTSANVFIAMSNVIRGQRALSLVHLIAMRDALSSRLKKKFSNDALVKSGMEVGMDSIYRNRANWYAILNKLFESDKMVKRGDFYKKMQSGRGSSVMKHFETIIDNDQKQGLDSLLVINETERQCLVGIKGKDYAEAPEPYKIRHATIEDGPQMKKLIKKALIAECADDVDLNEYYTHFFVGNLNEFAVCEFKGILIGFRQIAFDGILIDYVIPISKREATRVREANSCASGLVYILPKHNAKKLVYPLDCLLVKDIVKIKGGKKRIYARPSTELGETLCLKIGYKLVGFDNNHNRHYYDQTKKPPVYAIEAGALLKNTEKKLNGVMVPYEFCHTPHNLPSR